MEWKSQVPKEKWAAVEKALQTDRIEAIELLTGGLSSALVYKIVVQGRPYVLRLVMQVNPFNDPVRQYACMNIAAEAGIAPHVHYSNAEDAVSLTDFVARSENAPPYEELLRQLAATIRVIHSTPLFPALGDYREGIDSIVKRFHASRILPPQATAEHWQYYDQVREAYPWQEGELVSSHNDLNPNNLIFDGKKIWVIDWESAFRNDRYVDLSIGGIFFVSDPAQEELYLRAYFGDALDDYKRARYFLMQQVSYIYYGLGMLYIASQQWSPDVTHDDSMDTPDRHAFYAMTSTGKISFATYEGKLLYGKMMLNKALSQMKTPRFAESIRQMG